MSRLELLRISAIHIINIAHTYPTPTRTHVHCHESTLLSLLPAPSWMNGPSMVCFDRVD